MFVVVKAFDDSSAANIGVGGRDSARRGPSFGNGRLRGSRGRELGVESSFG